MHTALEIIVFGCLVTVVLSFKATQYNAGRNPFDLYAYDRSDTVNSPHERDSANQRRWRQPFSRESLDRRLAWDDRYEFSGWYEEDNGPYRFDDEDYYDEYDEYNDFDEYFDKDDLSFVDKETIANNEDEIYRVRAELEYDERRIERMAIKMKAMERNMAKMQILINSKYPFGGYYKK